MILDELLEFADAVSVIAAPGTAVMGDVIPLSVARDVGGTGPAQDQLFAVFTVDTEVDSAAEGATVDFQVVTADDSAITVGVVIIASTGVKTEAQLVAGAKFMVALPPTRDYSLFLAVRRVIAGEAVTAGKINAFLTRDQGTQAPYASPSQYV